MTILSYPISAAPRSRPTPTRSSVHTSPTLMDSLQQRFPLPPGIASRTEQALKGYLVPIGTSHRTVDKRVFVSYSRLDHEFALKLVDDLRQHLGGQEETVWIDTQQLSGGQ